MTVYQTSLTNISQEQVKQFRRAVRTGLKTLHRPEPVTAAAWADENFYLSSESSYQEGRWETLPFQVAPMNAMGNDDIREVNFVKSARVGYSKMLLAVAGYLIEHKKRNGLIFQPTDTAAKTFMKAHVESAIRDIPVWKELAPWIGRKHRDNTLESKRFTNAKHLWVLGGTAAANYREKSVDFVVYDELAAFDEDIEKEGSPTFLGDKRTEGSTFPKSIRGSTPKIKGECQIERAANEAAFSLYFYVPCPHCGHFQRLKWGGPDCEFGIKWDHGQPRTAFYACEKGCVIRQNELTPMQVKGFWKCETSGVNTRDGLEWFDQDNNLIEPPESVAFNIWTAYSPFTTWQRIVTEFLKAKDDLGKLKTFVNTTLGETWEDDVGEQLDEESLLARREPFPAEVPRRAVYLTAGVDTQDDRLELEITAWGEGEESWLVDYVRLYGDPGKSVLWDKLLERLDRDYRHESGLLMNVSVACIDSGGHYTDEVYKFCKRRPRRFIPIKGASVAGKPIANFPRTRNRKGVYLTEVGTDNAKEVLFSRLAYELKNTTDAYPGYRHHPIADFADEAYFKGLTVERKKVEFVKGKRVYRWICPNGARNEPTDCAVYSLAAVRIAQQHLGINLKKLTAKQEQPEPTESKPKATAKPAKQNSWLNLKKGSPWI